MEPSKPMDILNKLRRGSLDSNDRRSSMESGGSMDGRPASFDHTTATNAATRAADDARFKLWRDAKKKQPGWSVHEEDPATAWYSA